MYCLSLSPLSHSTSLRPPSCLSLTPPQLVTATLWEQRARRATRPQASAPARTVSPASPVTAAPKATSKAVRLWPRASVSGSHRHSYHSPVTSFKRLKTVNHRQALLWRHIGQWSDRVKRGRTLQSVIESTLPLVSSHSDLLTGTPNPIVSLHKHTV